MQALRQAVGLDISLAGSLAKVDYDLLALAQCHDRDVAWTANHSNS